MPNYLGLGFTLILKEMEETEGGWIKFILNL